MELKDTIGGMLSDDYRKRLQAEYCQTAIRRKKLHAALKSWEKGKNPNLKAPFACRNQWAAMGEYLTALEYRMKEDDIPIPETD